MRTAHHAAPAAPSTAGPRKLGLLAYWHAIGTDNMHEVVAAAETTWKYFLLLAYGTKPCSYQMAKALIAAAEQLTPGWAPDLLTVMEGTGERPPYRHGGKIGPSLEFLRDQQARGLSGDARLRGAAAAARATASRGQEAAAA